MHNANCSYCVLLYYENVYRPYKDISKRQQNRTVTIRLSITHAIQLTATLERFSNRCLEWKVFSLSRIQTTWGYFKCSSCHVSSDPPHKVKWTYEGREAIELLFSVLLEQEQTDGYWCLLWNFHSLIIDPWLDLLEGHFWPASHMFKRYEVFVFV